MTTCPPLARGPHSAELFDELLVVLVQQGDKAAMERLFLRWNKRLARAAYRYTGDAESARDLVQECWIGVWKGIARLENPARFRSYVFSVLHRRGADHVRVAIKDRARFAAPTEMPETAIAAVQVDDLALRQAFATLPPDQRLAAHLHFVEGFTLHEIAEVQGVVEGTAKSRLFHARRKLKAALSELSIQHTKEIESD